MCQHLCWVFIKRSIVSAEKETIIFVVLIYTLLYETEVPCTVFNINKSKPVWSISRIPVSRANDSAKSRNQSNGSDYCRQENLPDVEKFILEMCTKSMARLILCKPSSSRRLMLCVVVENNAFRANKIK